MKGAAAPTAADIRQALYRRYNQRSQGAENSAWVTIPEARAGAGFQGNDGQCDFLAINTWPSRGLQLIGHEIKVTIGDWHRELDKPGKAERFARHCRQWWVVVPSGLAPRVRDELTATPYRWGVLAVSDGHCRVAVAAPVREPHPVPTWWWIGWLAEVDRRQKAHLRYCAGATP